LRDNFSAAEKEREKGGKGREKEKGGNGGKGWKKKTPPEIDFWLRPRPLLYYYYYYYYYYQRK